ncbi:hypothetical protein Tco_0382486, partial [Tanacetum coccineum]
METNLLVLTKRSLNVSNVTTLVILLGNAHPRGQMMERRETLFIKIKELERKSRILNRKDTIVRKQNSWKDSSKKFGNYDDSGMSSTSKVGLGYGIKSNDEVLSYEEEMNRTMFNCTAEDFIDKPLKYTKGVPNEMSTSKSVTTNEKDVSESKEVEPSCVTHVKTHRQQMKNQETHKVKRKNWNEIMERELGEVQLNVVRQNVNSVRPNVNTGRANVNSVNRTNVNSVRTNVNIGRSKQPVHTNHTNSFGPVRPQGNWGIAVKTSAGYNWRRTRPNSNYNSGSNFVRTDHPLMNMEDRGIFDSGCSWHMTSNKDHLDDFE